ncbi:MAG: hypothetical protein LBV16_01620 [Elusimicrobiota bacterium]|jgi:hypothetical protein|nr:hypothetical protein [Elusimicrobiota bacterium]
MKKINEYINDKWECFLCCKEDDFKVLPAEYLGNYHPLCAKCADYVLYDENHTQHSRLTYHECVGDIVST